MKKIIVLIVLVFAGLNGIGQTMTYLQSGTAGYVIIDGQRYQRGAIQTYYGYGRDTSLQLTGAGISIGGYTRKWFYNADIGDTFISMKYLMEWADSSLEPLAGIATIGLGDTISGGVATNSMLYVASGGLLGNDATFTDDGSGNIAFNTFSGASNNPLSITDGTYYYQFFTPLSPLGNYTYYVPLPNDHRITDLIVDTCYLNTQITTTFYDTSNTATGDTFNITAPVNFNYIVSVVPVNLSANTLLYGGAVNRGYYGTGNGSNKSFLTTSATITPGVKIFQITVK